MTTNRFIPIVTIEKLVGMQGRRNIADLDPIAIQQDSYVVSKTEGKEIYYRFQLLRHINVFIKELEPRMKEDKKILFIFRKKITQRIKYIQNGFNQIYPDIKVPTIKNQPTTYKEAYELVFPLVKYINEEMDRATHRYVQDYQTDRKKKFQINISVAEYENLKNIRLQLRQLEGLAFNMLNWLDNEFSKDPELKGDNINKKKHSMLLFNMNTIDTGVTMLCSDAIDFPMRRVGIGNIKTYDDAYFLLNSYWIFIRKEIPFIDLKRYYIEEKLKTQSVCVDETLTEAEEEIWGTIEHLPDTFKKKKLRTRFSSETVNTALRKFVKMKRLKRLKQGYYKKIK